MSDLTIPGFSLMTMGASHPCVTIKPLVLFLNKGARALLPDGTRAVAIYRADDGHALLLVPDAHGRRLSTTGQLAVRGLPSGRYTVETHEKGLLVRLDQSYGGPAA